MSRANNWLSSDILPITIPAKNGFTTAPTSITRKLSGLARFPAKTFALSSIIFETAKSGWSNRTRILPS